MMDIFYYDGSLKKAEHKDLEKLKNKKLWIDVINITKEEAELLKNTFDLHPLTVEDLYGSPTRIKIEEFPGYLFCVFYGIQRSNAIELVELDFILGKNFIISSHTKEVATYTELKSNKERVELLFSRGIEFIFHKLLDMEIDNYLPILEYLDEQIDQIEEEVAKKPRHKSLKRILEIKQEIILVKKAVFPQREKISSLAKNDSSFLSKKTAPYFRDLYDHAVRVSDEVEYYREAVSNAMDIYISSVSNHMNEIMKVLSIVATIALPLNVISGMYGTNFENLPGSGNKYGFWIMILIMIAVSFTLVNYFRRRGWF